jgi:siroheme synthase-like protein
LAKQDQAERVRYEVGTLNRLGQRPAPPRGQPINKPTKRYLPIGLDVRGRTCVVVGGGQIGTRKATNLLQAGAKVTVVSPEATDALARLAEEEQLLWRKKAYEWSDLGGALLAVAATDDEDVNARLVQDARTRRVLVCDASDASRSEVIFGALHHGDEVTLAVFTDGQDPSLARRTRDRIVGLSKEWEGE